MRFRVIDFDSDAYRQTLDLRERVLRRPLGRSLSAKDLAGEREQWHFGLFDEEGKLTACLVAAPAQGVTNPSVRLRQMAVDPDHHSRGLGRRLIRETEEELGRRGITSITLHARTSATGFYARLGYRTTGDEFMEIGVPHQAMKKTLDSASGT